MAWCSNPSLDGDTLCTFAQHHISNFNKILSLLLNLLLTTRGCFVGSGVPGIEVVRLITQTYILESDTITVASGHANLSPLKHNS